MNNQRKNFQDSINKAMNTPVENQEKPYVSEQISDEYVQSPQNDQPDIVAEAKKKTPFDKLLKTTGIVLIIASIAALMWSGNTPAVDTSDAARQAIAEQVSTSLPVGTLLMSSDENIGAKDYTITHDSALDESKIWVWDYAAEDGDYVQVLVDGSPIGDAFMIKNKPRELKVPATGTVQVKGIRDGGGGITYAVRYELNSTTYFNSAPE
ncbi:MAG: hypothetical protein IJ300_03800, partial [Clostridia bacterium]|nr:hypothetical protein [Clostridia bacterium]